jgi:hypothetical protein
MYDFRTLTLVGEFGREGVAQVVESRALILESGLL